MERVVHLGERFLPERDKFRIGVLVEKPEQRVSDPQVMHDGSSVEQRGPLGRNANTTRIYITAVLAVGEDDLIVEHRRQRQGVSLVGALGPQAAGVGRRRSERLPGSIRLTFASALWR